MKIDLQVGEGLTQPLVSVAHLVGAGNVVALDKSGGWIRFIQTSKRVRLPREGNTFYLDMEVAESAEEEEKRLKGAAAFRRPE